jgi:hypothetical protein
MDAGSFYQQLLHRLSPETSFLDYKNFVLEDFTGEGVFAKPISRTRLSIFKKRGLVVRDAKHRRSCQTSSKDVLGKPASFITRSSNATPPPIIENRCRLRKTRLLNMLSRGTPQPRKASLQPQHTQHRTQNLSSGHPNDIGTTNLRRAVQANIPLLSNKLSEARSRTRKLDLKLPELPGYSADQAQ